MVANAPSPGPSPRGTATLTATSVLFGLCLFTFGLRMYAARTRKTTSVGWRWDLIWAGVTIFTGLIAYVFQILTTYHGLGHHITEIPLAETLNAAYWAVISIEMYIVAGAFAKLSIVALLISIQGLDATRRTLFLKALGVFQALLNLVLVLLILFQCKPIGKLWNPFREGVCRTTTASHNLSFFQGGVSALCDFTLGFWPLTMISQLHISKKSKISFCVLLGIGAFPGLASIVRTIVTYHVTSSFDITYNYPLLLTWTSVEIWSILILGSAPSLRPLFIKWFGKAIPSTRSGKTTSMGPTSTSRKGQTGMGNSAIVSSRLDPMDIEAALGEKKGGLTVSCSHVIVEGQEVPDVEGNSLGESNKTKESF
ncbi:hypothetical protein ANO11243_078010 [Dothideomycetidae sp. 11243]|nr:hypothetical protein ANO11243_078010 [fungal sp. No.11243]